MIMAGQGTAALELLDETGPLDALITPVGGGGLLSGCATIAKELNPADPDLRGGARGRQRYLPVDDGGRADRGGRIPRRLPTGCGRPSPES